MRAPAPTRLPSQALRRRRHRCPAASTSVDPGTGSVDPRSTAPPGGSTGTGPHRRRELAATPSIADSPRHSHQQQPRRLAPPDPSPSTPPAPSAPSGGGNGRALLRSGNLVEAARAFETELQRNAKRFIELCRFRELGVVLSVGDDPLRDRFADPRKRHQFLDSSTIDVHPSLSLGYRPTERLRTRGVKTTRDGDVSLEPRSPTSFDGASSRSRRRSRQRKFSISLTAADQGRALLGGRRARYSMKRRKRLRLSSHDARARRSRRLPARKARCPKRAFEMRSPRDTIQAAREHLRKGKLDEAKKTLPTRASRGTRFS